MKIKKLSPDAVIPSCATVGSAGMDVTAISKEYDSKNDCWVYHTGLAFQLPKGYVMLIFPRSSNRKTNYYLAEPPYQVGDRVGQIIIMPYPKVEFLEVEELAKTERGDGGFGSTGK